jgi:hypothetical protein
MAFAEESFLEFVEAEAQLGWMLMACLGAVSVVIGMFLLLAPRSAQSFAIVQLWSTSSLALCAIAAVDLMLGLRGTLSGLGLLLCRGVIFSATIALAFFVLRRPLHGALVPTGAWLRTGVTPTLIGLAATGWASHRAVEPAGGEPLNDQLNLREVSDAELRTDRGHLVPLYRMRSTGFHAQRHRARRQSSHPEVSQKAWERTAPDWQSDCHGWVFANGQFIIKSESVNRILDDNGYQRVDEPKAGDLIVYRNVKDAVLHTGTVKATGDDGFVLIESKWGFTNCFWHEPSEQPYSQRYAYYRSPRRGHLLASKSTDFGDAANRR